jgi:hypothetical protein
MQKKIAEAIKRQKYINRKPMSKEVIILEYSKRFKIAALTDSNLKKGIYYTWEQFKNNDPVNKDFTIQPNKKAPPSLFIKDDKGVSIFTRNAFAVCDGNKTYKVQEGFVFEIFKNNNAFYWMGLEQLI